MKYSILLNLLNLKNKRYFKTKEEPVISQTVIQNWNSKMGNFFISNNMSISPQIEEQEWQFVTNVLIILEIEKN